LFLFRLSTGAVHGQNNNGVAASASASAVAGSAGYGSSDNKPPTSVGADYGHESAAAASSVNGKGGSPMMVHTKTNYNDIFNVRVVCNGGDVEYTHTPNLVLTN